MTIPEILKNFPQQLTASLEIHNREKIPALRKFVVVAMGGSVLPAEVLRSVDPAMPLLIQKGYESVGLAEEDVKSRLWIFMSYSGNTEEVIRAFDEALKQGLPCVVIAGGGMLLERAKEQRVPYIELPSLDLQPRFALGLMLRALLETLDRQDDVAKLERLAKSLDGDGYESAGKALAEKMKGKIVMVYSSLRNQGLAYNWKARLNETAKTPSFTNVFSELNHNELLGFTRPNNFFFLLLKDAEDDANIIKRMGLTKQLLEEKEFPVEEIALEGSSRFQKAIGAVLLADWTSYHLALLEGVSPEDIALNEEFKHSMSPVRSSPSGSEE